MKKAAEYFIIILFTSIFSFLIFNYNLQSKNLLVSKKEILVENRFKNILKKTDANNSKINEKISNKQNNNKSDNKNNIEKKTSIVKKPTKQENINLFFSVIEIVKQTYVDPFDEEKIYENALKGILLGLDPHSEFLTEKDFKEAKIHAKGEFGGLGIVVSKDENFIRVISPIEDTPAERAGIKAGDYISMINNEPTYNMSLSDAVDRMRGKPNEEVQITILRKGNFKPIILDLKREIIKSKSIKGEIKNNNIIYLRITNFIESTADDLIKMVNSLKAKVSDKELKGVILDLRNNPGGLLDQSVKVSEVFLEKDLTVVSVKGRDDHVLQTLKSTKNYNLFNKNIPLVILVNEGSASASEIVAGALQDHKRGIVLGNKTFGKASVQQVLELPNGSGLKITIARYYTPNNKSLQAEGIEPDIVVKYREIKMLNEENPFEIREKDLKGHLSSEKSSDKNSDKISDKSKLNEKKEDDVIAKAIKENNKGKPQEEEINDYQLLRALDLIHSMSVFRGGLK